LTIYVDTSFFVSLYVKDAHSIAANRMLGGGERPPIIPLHIAEWTHAIAQGAGYLILTAYVPLLLIAWLGVPNTTANQGCRAVATQSTYPLTPHGL